MKSILQAFVRGHIPTQLRVSKPSAAYDKKLARLAKLEHKLLDRLKDDGETRAIFEEYVSEQDDMHGIITDDQLLHGYRVSLIMTVTSDDLVVGVGD